MFLKRTDKLKSNKQLEGVQYNLISLCGKLIRLEKLNPETEKTILPELKVLMDLQSGTVKDARYSFGVRWARNVLAVIYANQKEYEKAEMISPGIVKGHFSKTDNIRNMITYLEGNTHSELEQLMLKYSSYSKYDYLNLLGITYAQKDQLDSARAAFARMATMEPLPGNPFTIHIKDCHDCDHAAPQKVKYTPLTFIEKMIEMKNKANANKSEAAQNYYLVANGFYNITYYGNARKFYETPIGTGGYYNDYSASETTDENDCALALKYYLLAKESSADKEFRAKCTFMAAKCEQNTWYQHIPKNYEGDFKSGIYFRMLKKEYASTKYYSEILNECSYFALFAGK